MRDFFESIRRAVGALTAAVVVAMGAQAETPFSVEVLGSFDEPWAIAALPDGRFLLTEQKGSLWVVDDKGDRSPRIGGTPTVVYSGQGGLGDVLAHPNFAENKMIYLSYAEPGIDDSRGAAVARAVLDESGRRPALRDLEVIWRQYPKTVGHGHYGHRLAFDDDGYLWITSGDRQKFTPSQDMQSNMGKMLRLNDDGSIPDDNPFVDYYSKQAKVDDIGVYPEIWSLGHRNPLGLDFDSQGRLWEIEMGPAGGDELNLIERGANYGYPVVSNGDHYDGRKIDDHDTRPDFAAPAAWWTPVISPGDMLIYKGDKFSAWKGNALVAGLSSNAIVHVELGEDGSAEEIERYEMGARIRGLEEASDGSVYVIEDEARGKGGRLLRLTPK